MCLKSLPIIASLPGSIHTKLLALTSGIWHMAA